MMKTNKKIHGVTLIELMIALAISSIFLIGVVTIYGNSKRSYVAGEEFAYLQESGRIGMKFMVEDIRMAGYMGCAWNDGDASKFQCYLDTTANDNYICDNIAVGLAGYEAAGTPANNAIAYGITLTTPADPDSTLVTGAVGNWSNSVDTQLSPSFPMATRPPVAGSDIIVVRHAADSGVTLNSDKNNDANFSFDNQGSNVPATPGVDCHTPSDICEGDILIASDCNKSRVFQASQLQNNNSPPNSVLVVHNASGDPGNFKTSWGGNGTDEDNFQAEDTEILKFKTYAYYVANNPNGQPALYRHDGITSHAPVELVQGVENMQILYGVDSDNNGIANFYASANQVSFVAGANPIVSVRISLLVRTTEEVPKRPRTSNTFTLANTNVTNSTADGRLRKIFTTTIKIRNKGI